MVAALIDVERLAGEDHDRLAQRAVLHGARADAGREPAPQIHAAFGHAEAQRARRHVLPQRLDHRVAAAAMLGPERRQVRVEHALLDQLADDELRQVLRVRIDLLLDQRELLDDRPRRRRSSQGAAPAPASSRSC